MDDARPRTPYPTDVTDEEWAFAAPYPTLMDEEAPQRRYPLREVFHALRWIVRTGAQWRMLPTNFPPWPAVYQQARRWIAAGCFEAMVHDLRALPRWTEGRADDPTFVDQGYTGDEPAADAAAQGIRLEVAKLSEAKKGLVLLPRRWAVEPGWRGPGAWRATTNGCPKPSPPCISSPSPA